MGETMKKYTIVVITLVMLALLGACENPFVKDIVPGNTPPAGPTYTVIFDKNHNDTSGWTDADPTTKTVKPPATTVGSLPTPPTRAGYSFSGWNIAADGSSTVFDANIPVISDIRVFAKWEVAPYTIIITTRGEPVVGDSVTASRTTGKAGEIIALNFTLVSDKLHNRLVFSGTNTVIPQVDSAGPGTRSYTIAEGDAANGVITIIATFDHSDKELDTIRFTGTGNTDKTYGDDSFSRPATTDSGLGTITYSSSNPSVAAVDSSGQVTILKAGTTTITATREEDETYAKITDSYLLTVEKKPVTITGLSAQDKVYDGTATVTLNGTATIEGKVGDDVVTVTAGTAAFADKIVGNDKIVTFSGYSLDGAAKDNYTLSAQPASVTANITKLQLTVTESVTTSKPYDGNTTAAISISSTNKISTDTLTVTVTGTYASANVGTDINIIVAYTIGGTDAGNYNKPDNHSVAGTITTAAGSAVSIPRVASKTDDSITIRAVTMQSPNLGQTAEYAIGTTNSTPTSGWQDGLTFSGLTKGDVCYIFARSKADDNCATGAQQVSVAITVMDDSYRKTVIDFESDTIGKAYEFTNGDNSPTKVAVIADPDTVNHLNQKSLQITTGGNGWNQAAIIPVYLPYTLSNYESVSFRFRLLSVGSDTTPRSIQIYAAANTSAFVQYGFGNSSGNNFAANLVGGTPAVLFNDSYKNTWTEYEITCSPGSTISNLQGNIYIAIGMNCNDVRDYLLDDITFMMNDTFDPPPYITSASAVFDNNAKTDIDVTMALQGKTLTDIKKSGTALNSGSDYSISGNTVTLKISYLENLPDGSTPLTFTFSNGTTCTFTINIGLLLNYDFSTIANGPVSGIGYSSSNISATVTGGILRVTKTNTNHTTENFILSFNVGSGNLSNYSAFKINIKGVSGDYTNAKDVRAWVGSTELGSKQAFLTTSFQDVLVPITYASANTYTGEVRVGIGLNNTQAVTYEITSIELVPK
jgi:uncharacterized repeat protein (TIGR02543 family)